jgi:hypothetical protein
VPVIGTLPINNFSGTQTSPARDVPAGAEEVVIDFDGSTMLDPTMEVDTRIEFAPDGVTWREIAGARFRCGSKDRSGNPRAVYPVRTAVPTDGALRRLRGTLTVIGGAAPLTTTLRISTLP